VSAEVEGLVVGEVPPAVAYSTALAEHLGDGWTARDDRPRWQGAALLVGPEGEEISVRLGSEQSYSLAAERGRVLMHGIFPTELQGFTRGPSTDITVSASKPAATVAKELKRRLLDGYRERLAAAWKRKHDHDQREHDRALLVDQAAAALQVFGKYVNVHDHDRPHGDPTGKLSLGNWRDPVRIQLEIERAFGPESQIGPPLAKAQVDVHRDLLPHLLAALVSLNGDSRPQPAEGDPQPVWVVHRADDDSMEAFQDEHRARQYAGFFEGAVVDVLTPMSCSAAGQFFIDTVHGEEVEPDVAWLCDDCWQKARPGLLASCEDGCERDICHTGACHPEDAPSGQETCDWCQRRTRLNRFEGE
jgi:hypothetical protein